MESNKKGFIVVVLVALLVIILMIPISSVAISNSDLDELDKPIHDLNNRSLNDVFDFDLDTELDNFNNKSLNQIFGDGFYTENATNLITDTLTNTTKMGYSSSLYDVSHNDYDMVVGWSDLTWSGDIIYKNYTANDVLYYSFGYEFIHDGTPSKSEGKWNLYLMPQSISHTQLTTFYPSNNPNQIYDFAFNFINDSDSDEVRLEDNGFDYSIRNDVNLLDMDDVDNAFGGGMTYTWLNDELTINATGTYQSVEYIIDNIDVGDYTFYISDLITSGTRVIVKSRESDGTQIERQDITVGNEWVTVSTLNSTDNIYISFNTYTQSTGTYKFVKPMLFYDGGIEKYRYFDYNEGEKDDTYSRWYQPLLYNLTDLIGDGHEPSAEVFSDLIMIYESQLYQTFNYQYYETMFGFGLTESEWNYYYNLYTYYKGL